MIARRLSSVALVCVTFLGIGCPAPAKMPTVQIGGNKINVEVASTAAQIERGLMYRTAMPENNGMIFLFRPPQAVKFWMAHCFISLDMLMIRDGKIVKIFENVPPERDKPEDQCPTYPARDQLPIAVSEVVEVNGGYAKRHGIKEGDTVKFSMDAAPKAESTEKK